MKNKALVLLGFLSLLSVVGCASFARKVVVRPGEGGTVAIFHSEASRGRAEEYMTQICGSKSYQITEEREVSTGQVLREETTGSSAPIYSFQDSSGSNSGKVKLNTGVRRAQVQDTTEWQISFICK